jgi:gliding motility-associated-like protein
MLLTKTRKLTAVNRTATAYQTPATTPAYAAGALTAFPMKKLFLPLILVLFFSVITRAQVTVNATAGTATANYTTLGGAFAAINAGTHRAAIAVVINGNTTETATAVLNASGSGAAAYTSIVIRPDAATSPVVSGAINSGPVVRLNGSNNVTIEGSNVAGGTTRNLTISNTSTTSSNVLQIGSVGTVPINNVIVRNTILINGTNTSTAVLVGDAGITGSPGYFSNLTLRNNDVRRAYIGIYIYAVVSGLINDVIVENNTIDNSGANAIRLVGIYAQGINGIAIRDNRIGNFETTSSEFDRAIWLATATTNATVSGNNIHDLAYSGTSSYAPIGINVSPGVTNANVRVTDNTITALQSSGSGTTMGMFVYSAVSGVTIDANQISNIKNTNTAGYGASGINLAATTNASNTNIRNNFIWDIAGYGYNGFGSGDNGNGIVIDGGGGYNIDFNTVHLNTNQTLTGGHRASCLLVTANVTSTGTINVRNNIFANSQTTGNANSRFCLTNVASNGVNVFATVNYNNYYSSSGNLTCAGTNASITNTLAQVQTYLTGGREANGRNIQPVFVGANDLHLDRSLNNTLNNLGAPLAGITVDIDGDTRSATTPDMGADEFTPCNPITITTQPVNATICEGRDTLFRVTATGVSTYRWQVDDGSGFVNINNNAIYGGATTATLTLTNPPASYSGYIYRCQLFNGTAGCPLVPTATRTLTVNANPVAVVTPASATTICQGGSVVLDAQAGFNYEWLSGNTPVNPANNTSSYTATTAGNYAVVLVNSITTCRDTSAAVAVVVNPLITSTANMTICASQLPYTWNGQTITAGGNAVATFTTPSLVTGCDSTVTLNLTVNPLLSANDDVTICVNQLPYTWNGQTITAGGNAVATFTTSSLVTGCDSTTTLNLTVNPAIMATENLTICSSQLPYNWNGQAITAAGTAVATFTMPSVLTGCDSTTTLNLSLYPDATATITPGSDVLCSGASTAFTLSSSTPGTTFTWTVVPTNVSGAAAGSGSSITQSLNATATTPGSVVYTITPEANGCSGPQTTATVTVNPIPNTIITPANDILCSGNTTNFALSSDVGGATYAWTVTATDVSGASAGNGSSIAQTLTATSVAQGTAVYSVTATANGCAGPVSTATAAVNPRPVVTPSPGSETICSGNTTGISFSTNITGTAFNWTVVQNGVSGATAGTGNQINQVLTTTGNTQGTAVYTITPSVNGCDGTPVSVTVTVNPVPVATVAPSTQTICSGGVTSFALSSDQPNTSFNWTVGTSGVNGMSSGSGNVIAQTLTTLTPFSAGSGTYIIVPTAAGCAGAPVQAAVMVNPLPNVTATPGNETICSGTTTAITLSSAVAGTTYSWTVTQSGVTGATPASGNTIAQNLTATNVTPGTATYTIAPVSAGCAGTPVAAIVTVKPAPHATVTPGGQAICSGQTTSLALSSDLAATTYSWTVTANGVTGATAGTGNNIAQTLTTGNGGGSVDYHITPVADGCTGAVVNAQVVVNPLPNIFITKSNNLDCNYSDTRLSATGAVTYTWSPATGLDNPNIASPVASPQETTTYTVTGRDANGCVNTATVLVEITTDRQGPNLVANGFTPNGDGVNDCFGIKYWGVISKMEMTIYNRGGQRVFYSTQPTACWDGRFQGQPQPAGVYVYYIRATTQCGVIERKGTVTLIR